MLGVKARLRTLPLANHVLALQHVPRHKRYCLLCQVHGVEIVEDAAHFIFECPSLHQARCGLTTALLRACAHPVGVVEAACPSTHSF